MKKTALFLAVVMLLSLFAGCGRDNTEIPECTVEATIRPLEGEVISVDTAMMTCYDLYCGMRVYGPSGMDEEEIDGMAAFLDNGFFLFQLMEEPKAGSILEDFTLQEYADRLTGSNGIPTCQTDIYGSLATAYTALGEEEDYYYYYLTVHETQESFWFLQVVCIEDVAEKYADNMAQWSSTLTERPPLVKED